MQAAYSNYLWASIYAIVPALLILFYIYKRDKFPEPPRVVIVTLILGFGIVVPLDFLIPIIENIGRSFHRTVIAEDFYMAFIRAAFLEETFKYLILVFYCLHLDEFDEPMDAIVYGVAASIGFAVKENWDYVLSALKESYSLAKEVAFIRTISAVLFHALAGIMMGFFIKDAVFEKEDRKLNLTFALLFPVCLHGFYDFIIFSKMISDWWIYVLILVFLIRVYFIIKHQVSLQTEDKSGHVKTVPLNSEIFFSIFVVIIIISFGYFILN